MSKFERCPCITALLAPGFPESELAELEAFRERYEAENGSTDLTRRYTTQLLGVEHNWLKDEYPERYIAGMPPYVAAHFKEKIRQRIGRGEGDTLDPRVLEMYMSGRFPSADDDRNQGRSR